MDDVSSPKVTEYRSSPALENFVTNLRAWPLRDGEPTMLMLPLELPGPPVSWTCAQLLKVWMLVILTASEGASEVSVPLPAPTVMAMFVSHAAPWLPHALTCKVCAPAAAVTEALKESLSTTAVFELLSSE